MNVPFTPPAFPALVTVPAPGRITAALVNTAQHIGYDQLPASTIAATKRVLLDTLAVAWAAGEAGGTHAARALALRGAPGQSSLWGHRGIRRDAGAATFFNATLAAALDFDSLAGQIHADATVAPAALAVGEQHRASGRELITALALGNELAIRLASAMRTERGFFHTSIAGVFGAALAAARLQRLDAARTHHALGIALCQASGTLQSHVEQRLTKRLQSAFAARDGVVSADLAALDITGPDAVFEGPYGLFALFEQGDPEAILEGFGTRFQLEETALKRFPACGCSHAAIQATIDLVSRHGIRAEDVARGEIIITPYMNRLVGGAFAPEANPQVTGQFNVRYAVATVLKHGGFTFADIAPEAVLSPGIRPLVEKLRVRVDDELKSQFAPSVVIIETHEGRRLLARVDALPGGPAAPLTPEEHQAKVHGAFTHGPHALSKVQAEALTQRVLRLEGVDDVSNLFDVLR